jgi:hypothetical protein
LIYKALIFEEVTEQRGNMITLKLPASYLFAFVVKPEAARVCGSFCAAGYLGYLFPTAIKILASPAF